MNPNDAYHADTSRVSHSMLEVYRESPAKYHGRFETGTIPKPAATAGQILGLIVHCLVLEPEEFSHRYVVSDCADRRGNKWKRATATAEEQNKECLLPSQVEPAKAMADAVLAHPEAAKLLSADPISYREEPIYWTDDTGLKCKAKPDILIKGAQTICVDLKTAADPSPEGFAGYFLLDDETRRAGAIWSWGYHRQAAWYLDGLEANYYQKGEWIFIVVGKAPPHDVYVYRLDPAYVEIGRGQNTHDICNLARSIVSDDWTAPGQSELQTIQPPKWAREG